jgi:hypothetical protein
MEEKKLSDELEKAGISNNLEELTKIQLKLDDVNEKILETLENIDNNEKKLELLNN